MTRFAMRAPRCDQNTPIYAQFWPRARKHNWKALDEVKDISQSANIDDLDFSISEITTYASTVIKLLPRDVIATCTPGGVGDFRKPQLYLKPGMTVDVEITGVGTLSNGIVDEV